MLIESDTSVRQTLVPTLRAAGLAAVESLTVALGAGSAQLRDTAWRSLPEIDAQWMNLEAAQRAIPQLVSILRFVDGGPEVWLSLGTYGLGYYDARLRAASSAAKALSLLGWQGEKATKFELACWAVASERWEDALAFGAPAVEPLVAAAFLIQRSEQAEAALVKLGLIAASGVAAIVTGSPRRWWSEREQNQDGRRLQERLMSILAQIEPVDDLVKYMLGVIRESKSLSERVGCYAALRSIGGEVPEADELKLVSSLAIEIRHLHSRILRIMPGYWTSAGGGAIFVSDDSQGPLSNYDEPNLSDSPRTDRIFSKNRGRF